MNKKRSPGTQMARRDKILNELESRMCKSYMQAPIRQCKVRHRICFTQVKNCPICRQLKSNARCFKLEALLAKNIFPCRYKSEGCNFIDLDSYIKEHEVACSYGNFKCVFKASSECNWSGSIKAFLEHAKLAHSEVVFINADNTIIYKNFAKRKIEQTECRWHGIFVRDRDVFKCTIDVQHDTGMMRWCTFYVGVENCPDSFIYKIQIENHHNPSQKVSLEGSCRHYMQEENVFENNACMFTNYRVLERFCRGSDLKFTISVEDRVKYINRRS